MNFNKQCEIIEMDAEYINTTGTTREKYWERSNNHRMDKTWELDRLETVLYGFYYKHIKFFEEDGFKPDCETLAEFIRSKRPYGNKDVAQSIAYNLGWDPNRCLCFDIFGLPENIEDSAMELHRILLEKFK